MNKRKKVDMSKLCLKSKPSSGVPNKIVQFFTSNEPSTSSSTEISRPLVESVNLNPIQPTVPSIENTLKSYEHTKAKMNRLAKRKSELSSSSIGNFFEPTNNMSMADFETPKRIKPSVSNRLAQPKPKRTTSNRLKQNNIKNLLKNNKTEESLFSELLAQQCASENLHPDELQMALALSKSLVETFSQETNTNSSISKTLDSKLTDIQKTLDNFGFKTAGQYTNGDMKAILRVNKNHKWRRKFSKRNLDYIRKSFDEKLSMIFTESIDQNVFVESNNYPCYSHMLREMRINSEDTFFQLQSSDVHSSKLKDRYYSTNIFEESVVRNDYLLKNWDEIPGRTPSPERREKFDLSKITELSDVSRNLLEYPEFDSDPEIREACNEIPLITRSSSRDVESPDLFSDSEAELDETNKKSPPKLCERLSDEKFISDIVHFENYTSDEAKIKDVVTSKLNESNVDIFADLSVDMIDLTSECGSNEEDNARSPSLLTKSNQRQSLNEENHQNVSQPEDVFTLSNETCMSEELMSDTTTKAVDSSKIQILTESDTTMTHVANNSPTSVQFNTQDITLVYSEEENITEIYDVNLAASILISDDSDDETKSANNLPTLQQTKAQEDHNSIVSFIELPYYSENTLIDNPMSTDILSSPMTENISNLRECDKPADVIQLTEEDEYFQASELCVNDNIGDTNINLSPSTNNNDTQNISLVYSEDGDSNDKIETQIYSTTNSGLKTPPRHNATIDYNDIMLPNLNNHTEFLQNLTQNISDSIEISDDEINYSAAQLNQVTPTKTPEKSIEIDSDDENDNLLEEDSNLLGKSMHSFLRRYERKISDDINNLEDGNDENNEVNQSVNEFLFKSRFESTDKRPNISSTKSLLKRYPSEPSFSRVEGKTPKKLCFDQLKMDDEFDRLVFGDKLNHDIVALSPGSPLREIPKSPEPVIDTSLEDLNCPYNYYQPEEEYDIVINQITPKANLNGTIDLNETLYEGEKYIYKTRNVTPEPNYKNMDISLLHIELKRYGLKKISRPKAIKLLEYIYNETHPIIQDTDKETTTDSDQHIIASSQPTKQTTRSPIKPIENPTTEIIGSWSRIDFSKCDRNVDYFKTDNFTLNLLNSNEMIYLPSKPRSGKLQYCPLPLHIAFYNLFRSNSNLRNALFMYQPIEVEKIYLYFKSIGAKYEMNDLISFLDRHCITFRTDPKRKTSDATRKI